MTKMNCCEKEGFCTTYQRELWGQQWRIIHGVDGTPEQQAQYQAMFKNSSPVVQSQSIPAPAAATKPKGCGCGKRKIGPR